MPVSPVSKIVTSAAASLSSIANTAAIAGAAEVAPPNRASAAVGASLSTNSRLPPITATTPGAKSASRIAAPPTSVPLVEPRSRNSTPAAVGSSSQCSRDTWGSATIRSASAPLPMRSRRRPRGCRTSAPSAPINPTQRAGSAVAGSSCWVGWRRRTMTGIR